RPSEEINSVYIKSAPFALHTARKGGSDTSSMGANNNGKSPNSMFPIFTILIKNCVNLRALWKKTIIRGQLVGWD
ncbi:MAG: hypothetical protein RLZ91_1423, partial [Bacteroidota bacterium]